MKNAPLFFVILLILLCPIISYTEQAETTIGESITVEPDYETARAIANFMEMHYDITILIGSECEKASVPDWFSLGDKPSGRTPFLNILGSYSYTKEIQMIDDAFSIYPPAFFTKFKCNEAPNGIRILLPLQIVGKEKSFAGAVTIDDGYYNIFLGIGMFIDLNIHHEIWHAMEYRITADNPHAFDGWTDLNPEEFEYSEDHYTQDQWEQTEPEEDWFARGYSRIADYEDRATTIEALFRHNPDWWSTRPHLQKKLDFLLEITESLFGNVYFYE